MIVALWKGEKIVEVTNIFQTALENQWQQFSTYRLLVIGESNVGKTTLIQSLFDLKKNESIPQFQVEERHTDHAHPPHKIHSDEIYSLRNQQRHFFPRRWCT